MHPKTAASNHLGSSLQLEARENSQTTSQAYSSIVVVIYAIRKVRVRIHRDRKLLFCQASISRWKTESKIAEIKFEQ